MIPRPIRRRSGSSRVTVVFVLLLATMLIFAYRGASRATDAAVATSNDRALHDAALQENTPLVSRVGLSSPSRTQARPDAATMTGLRALIGRAERLLASGRANAMRIPEAEADAGLRTPEARRATQQWQDWSRSWWNDVRSFQSELEVASRGVGYDQPEYILFQDLRQLANRMTAVTTNPSSTTNIPTRGMRRQNFDSADAELARVRTAWDELREQM